MSALVTGLALVLLLGLPLLAAAVLWRRAARDGERLRLPEAARAQGAVLPAADNASAAGALGAAARRCVFCPEHARCDELLASGDWKALRAICPNQAYLDSLRGD